MAHPFVAYCSAIGAIDLAMTTDLVCGMSATRPRIAGGTGCQPG
jgi:hypothetical protein